MISVTDLSSYLYCQRKLYFSKVLNIKEPPRKPTIQGTIIHSVLEYINEQQVVTRLTASTPIKDFEQLYRQAYYSALKDIIQFHKRDIERAQLSSLTLFQGIWPELKEEAQNKTKQIFQIATEKKVYGNDLWNSLPKAQPELRIQSEKLQLIGVIDAVEESIPIEIKTGKPPKEGVWKEHMIQLGSYILLLSEHLGKPISEGYVEYRMINERRKVVMNPFLKDEILSLISRVHIILQQKELPEKVTDLNKCARCGIKESCYAR